MRKELQYLTATESIQAIKSKEISAVDLVTACSAQIEKLDSGLCAWAHFNRENLIRQAEAVDTKLRQGESPGALCGVPVGVKDIINVTDMPCGMGSPIWEGFTPGNDARVVSKLRLGGATIAGKTVTAEFAVHTPGKTVNPHNPEYSPGTSSSGSAAAVSAAMVSVALGTQTAGSITRPASYCGIYGFKPSFGLIPRTGMLKTTDTLDQVGYFSRCVEDIELMFDIVRVKGADFPIQDALLNDPLWQQPPLNRPWKVGVVSDSLWVWSDARDYARKALTDFVTDLSDVGVIVEDLRLSPEFNQAHSIHATIYDKTLAYYFKEEYQRHQLISEVLNAMILKGQKISLDDYKLALTRQAELAKILDQLFENYDAIVTLTTAGIAPKYAEQDVPDSCLVWSLCGVPVVSVPRFKGPHNLPFGIQVVARRYSDIRLLNFLKYLKACGIIGDAEISVPRQDR